MNYLTLVIIMLILLNNEAIAEKINKQIFTSAAKKDLAQIAKFSPRTYCQDTGGVVSETEKSHVYLCRYKSKLKCVKTDTKSRLSWPIAYRDCN